jgi:hypothetical protein
MEADGNTFTAADRARARQVLAEALDEMDDSCTLDAMFAPHAEILRLALTDSRVTAALEGR